MIDGCKSRIRPAPCRIETGLHYPRNLTLKKDIIRRIVGHPGIGMASSKPLLLTLLRPAFFLNLLKTMVRWHSIIDAAISMWYYRVTIK